MHFFYFHRLVPRPRYVVAQRPLDLNLLSGSCILSMTNILHVSSIYTDKGSWGMQSDGFCRISTRAGSAPVVKRNWHWGPLVHQTHADSYGLLFSRAVRLAIDDLVAGRIPPEPPSIDDYERILDETVVDEKTPVHKKCEWKSRKT